MTVALIQSRYSIVKLAPTTARMLLSLEAVSLIPSALVSFELRPVIWNTPILADFKPLILRPP